MRPQGEEATTVTRRFQNSPRVDSRIGAAGLVEKGLGRLLRVRVLHGGGSVIPPCVPRVSRSPRHDRYQSRLESFGDFVGPDSRYS